ncbi:cytohesin-interacting protein isoform X2 [Parus major]|uniref:cytohesin-interacting protein isoform X2 n=1 Tax=Parus major TaxID=9157 RepID=UPI0007713252|nr:cytohesin-interacting protein isoform X2 [Parus major]
MGSWHIRDVICHHQHLAGGFHLQTLFLLVTKSKVSFGQGRGCAGARCWWDASTAFSSSQNCWVYPCASKNHKLLMPFLSCFWSQLTLARSSSLDDSSKPQRHLVAILKEDKETFGFEIQTIRFPHQNDFSLEVCTCVCRIQEESPAHLSGLQAGDILTSINGVSTEGFGHKQIVDLIKSSGNYLRLETINGALFLRKMELESRLQALKALQQRWGELRVLLARERLLLHGEETDTALLGELEPEEPSSSPGPFFPAKPRFSSESSSRSRLSSMTVGSQDSFQQICEDCGAGSLSRQSSTDEDCVFPGDAAGAAARSSLRRNRSISLASSGSAPPLRLSSSCSSSFGTLPRKSRRASVRKHLLKFIPGFHRAVEEEESRV